MLEYALLWYDQYYVFFYALVVLLVLVEWPITILTLTLLAPKLGIGWEELLLLSLVGDFWGDLLHFYVGRYGYQIQKFFKIRFDNRKFKKLQTQIDRYPLLEKLIIIKYTPPLTSLGLVYLGFSSVRVWEFIKYTLPLCVLSSVSIVAGGYLFGAFWSDNGTLWRFFLGIGVALFVLITVLRRLGRWLVASVQKKYKKSD